MWFRELLFKRYYGDEIIWIFWHHWFFFVKITLFYIFIILILILLYKVLNWFWHYIFWLLWLILYFKYLIDFLDLYLDSIILTKKWIYIYRWDWLLKYSTQYIPWEWVDGVDKKQDWLLDVILNKWNLIFTVENNSYIFEDIFKPSQLVDFIVEEVENRKKLKEENNQNEIDKFDILINTLWDIIKDYLNNKNK